MIAPVEKDPAGILIGEFMSQNFNRVDLIKTLTHAKTLREKSLTLCETHNINHPLYAMDTEAVSNRFFKTHFQKLTELTTHYFLQFSVARKQRR